MMASEAAMDDVHGPGGNKDAAGGGAGAVRPPEQGLKCPRCDSPNTKFCYYNNYSLAQPRYFCKTCRRYWTKGGALRNVPVGGGCRKSKKSKSSSSNPSVTSSIRLSSDGPAQELRLYQLGIPPAVDFHLGAGGLPFSRLHHPSAAGPPGVFNPAAAEGGAANHLISFGDLSCSAAALPTEAAGATAGPLLGFSYPIQGVVPPPFTDVGIGTGGDATTSGTNLAAMHSNLAASIESLSSINQGLHWKLQQQRLAMFFGDDQSQQHHGKEGSDAAATTALPSALLEGANRSMSCQMPASSKEICTPAAAGGVSGKGSMGGDNNSGTTEWFLGSTPTTYTTPTAHGSLSNGSSAAGSNWNGVQAWNDMHQFSALP